MNSFEKDELGNWIPKENKPSKKNKVVKQKQRGKGKQAKKLSKREEEHKLMIKGFTVPFVLVYVLSKSIVFGLLAGFVIAYSSSAQLRSGVNKKIDELRNK